ncbi:MAG TPA: 16S rRNA (adenine(1518)-N(6)/adenine(1519)-N(6))-dimethyltransferase [Bacteroidales bacterium]|mgnify:FL=1|jgi:16S rRNA (adenine1518-N6/adenine1519-N6)-dimethyltransferase|nr:16S rRNA (adenine(1518)-N(6)/adenine(1519)-N(6))-dimethyltransferase RsmA [Bacteroidales bacterium]HBA13353.1 16S rRNA (adenine(1518)-N(6)/adenine(1519)-N(6))-dimethyltransferase [Bacteroidales bacterium]
MRTVRPKKALGQHFLRDMDIARAIAGTVDLCADLPILEIGPGTGVLTQFLYRKGRQLKVVEIDSESVLYLRENYPDLDIIESDFLKLDLQSLFDGRQFVLTGNYPYNISSQILFKMLDNMALIPCCTGMLQREVARRICSGPRNKEYGILSVLIQAWYNTEYLFTVDEKVFDPPPKVKSAVIRMTRNDRVSLGCDKMLFKKVVKTTFGMRRKMIRNSLRQVCEKDVPLPMDCPYLEKRPEQLSVEDFITLTNMIDSLKA